MVGRRARHIWPVLPDRGGPRELKARHRCIDSWPRMDACADARGRSAGSPTSAADRRSPAAAARLALDLPPNPSLHRLRDEL